MHTFYTKDFIAALQDLQKNPEDLKNIKAIYKLIKENNKLLNNDIINIDSRMYNSAQALNCIKNLINNKKTEKNNKIILFCAGIVAIGGAIAKGFSFINGNGNPSINPNPNSLVPVVA